MVYLFGGGEGGGVGLKRYFGSTLFEDAPTHQY